MMQTFLAEQDKSMIIKIAKKNAKEDFIYARLRWKGVSIVAFTSGLYVYSKTESGPLASLIGFLGPPVISYLKPVNLAEHRFHELQSKSEEYQNVYRTAYERAIRNQRLKHSIIGTGCSIVILGVYAALAVATIIGISAH